VETYFKSIDTIVDFGHYEYLLDKLGYKYVLANKKGT